MCIQVFFIRAGKMIERDVAIFPFFANPEEAFVSYIGRFYLHQNHLKPDNIFVPIGTDTDLLKELLDVDVFTPFRGQKKQLVKLAQKNATIALRSEERRVGKESRSRRR